MTPTDMAKVRVAQAFAALTEPPYDGTWREMVRGGFETTTRLTGAVLTGYAGPHGEYAVYAGKPASPMMVTLIAGSYAQCSPDGAAEPGVTSKPESQNNASDTAYESKREKPTDKAGFVVQS